MNSYVLKSFKGISDYEDKGLQGSFKVGINLDVRKKVDSLSCQQTLVQEGAGVVVDLIRWIIPCLDGNSYLFGNAGKIYKRTSAGTITLVSTDADGAITGACEWYLNTPKTYLFWATATKIHCKEIPGASNWSDVDALAGWPKTTLTSSSYHTMIQAVGSLQIANEDWLAMVGYDGSFSHQALNLFKKNYAKALVERGGYIVVGSPSKSTAQESELVAWDTSAESWNDKKIIKGGAVNALIDVEIPLAQVGTAGEIYFSDLQNRLPIVSIPGGGYCNPGGVANDGGLALFGIYGNDADRNGIYSYGRKILNGNRVLNLEYNVGECDEIGAIAKVGSDILVTYKNGSDYFVKKVDTANKATAYYYSLDLKPPVPFSYLPTWGQIVLTMKALPASCQVEVFYKLDKTGSFIQAQMEGDIAAFTTTGGTEAVFLVGEEAKIFEIEIKLTPSVNTTPEIYKAELFFE